MFEVEEAIVANEAVIMDAALPSTRQFIPRLTAQFSRSTERAVPAAGAQLDGASDLLRVFDLFAMLAAALCALSVNLRLPGYATWLWHPEGNGQVLLVGALLAPFCLDWAGLYAEAGSRGRVLAFGRVVGALASVLGLLVLVAATFTTGWPSTAKMLFEWSALTLALMLCGRLAVLLASALAPKRRLLADRVAVLGSSDLAGRVATHLRSRASRTELVGLFDAEGRAMPPALTSGGAAGPGLRELAMQGAVDHVLIALDPAERARAAALARELSPYAVDVAVCGELLPTSNADSVAATSGLAHADLRLLGGVPTLRLVRRPMRRRQVVAKAIEDRVLGLLLLIGLSPLLLAIGLTVRLTSPGPALFRQKRHGFRNREIVVFKFRTMRADAADHGGRVQTTRGDPRVTRVGAFLRASSLDELPQLLNVVRGEMSLVGPRPLPVDMRTNGLLCSEIVADYANRHRVRPGITGWAQINGYRGATTTPEQVSERVRLDNGYIDNWSLWLDLKIMLLTLVRVLDDDNAF